MGAAYRSSSSNNTASTPASSLVLSMPSGFQANDHLVASIAVAGGTGATISTPTGWTLLASVSETTDIQTSTYWKLATGYESSTTWVFDTTRQASGAVAAYSGGGAYQPPIAGTGTKTASATSAVPGAVASTWETGLTVQTICAQNTVGTSTMTAGGTFTQRVDICTTASSFIELAMQDRSKGLPLNSIPANAATISQATANSVATSLFIDDQRPVFNSLVTDYYIAGSSTSSNTSKNVPNVVANHPNELLLAFVTIQNGVTTVSSITGGGLTWVNVSRANAKAGSTEVWRAFAPTPQSFTATITFSAATTSDNWVFVGIVGADMTGTNGSGAIGATAATSSTSAAPTVSITTTRNNSWVWGAGNDGTSNVTVVAGSGQTILRNNGDSTNVTTGWVQRQNAITATSGTSVTMNDTTPSADSCNILAIEILPAIYHNLGAQGAGG